MDLKKGEKICASSVDGIFYPDNKEDLANLVRSLLDECDITPGKAGVIISPHAAYKYSGSIAATAFTAASAGTPDNIVLIGPVHRESVGGVILPESNLFQTPLGSVRVNQELANELITCSTVLSRNDIPHLEEHCLEVQLPFIQILFPKAQIIPILLTDFSLKTIKLLANAIQTTFLDKLDSTLFVVSANMSSYHPIEDNTWEAEIFLGMIMAGDWKGIIEGIKQKTIGSCCTGGIASMLYLHDIIGGNIEILGRGNSLDPAEDNKNIVQYAAISITKDDHGIQSDGR